MRAVERLRFNTRKTFSGRVRGERLTKRKGISIEFADYREYSHGDDLRHLDWNVLARLQSPVIKTYQDEEDLAVYLALDCSSSMSFGDPLKLSAACKVLAALALAALNAQDALNPRVIGKRQQPPRAIRSRSSYPKFAAWLNGQTADGDQVLSQSLKEFAGSALRAGVVVIASDGLDPSIRQSIRVLSARGHEVWFVQILSAEELDPDMEGDLKLIDVESGVTVEVTANSAAIEAYRKNLKTHCEGIAAECQKVGGRYALLPNNRPLMDFIRDTLRREGWLST
ncbi:MAG TPA: DUF58 domain-containing protein [Fimbriimonadaceae bacterium]